MTHPSRSPTCSALLLLVLLSTAAAQPHPEGPTEATFPADAAAVVDVPFHLDEPGEVSVKLLPTDDDPIQAGAWSLHATFLHDGSPLAPAEPVDGGEGTRPVALAADTSYVLRLEVEPDGVAGTTRLALVRSGSSDGGNGATLDPSVGIRLTAQPVDGDPHDGDDGNDGTGAGADASGGAGGGTGTDDETDPGGDQDATVDPTVDQPDGPGAPQDGYDPGPDSDPADGPTPTDRLPVDSRLVAYVLLALAVGAVAVLLRRRP